MNCSQGGQPAGGHSGGEANRRLAGKASREKGGVEHGDERCSRGSEGASARNPDHTKKARRTGAVPVGATRFFLAKAGAIGNTPAFDRELATEGEAKVEALKSGLNYYSVVEWRATADFAGKNPQVRSEAVKRQS